ncbi:ABC transporter permease subunit [Halobellus sp. GM3]|uniref:ABC transporter permease subunit n=1 Tax=Halobellus sp. GM3 TaxID=3458410 RepID=UPI00403E2887
MSTGADVATDREGGGASLLETVNPLAKPLRYKLGLFGFVLLAVLPIALTPLQALTVATAYFFAMFAMSWDVVSGYTGQISLGHGAFFTAGGYTSTLLNLTFGLDPVLTIPAGVVVAVVAGLILGIPTLRLKGPYFSLVTLIAPLILLRVFIVYSDVLGGTTGLSRPDALFDLGSTDAIATYYVAFGLFTIVLAVLLAVTRSNAGDVFTAIRESEDAVSSAGLNPAKFKLFAFALSAAIGGLAGAVFVHTPVGSPTPSSLLDLFVSVEVIIAAIIGGMGTIVGAAVGGLFFVLLREVLSGVAVEIPMLGVSVAEVDTVLFAVLTIALVYYYPSGLLGGALTEGRRLQRGFVTRFGNSEGGLDDE